MIASLPHGWNYQAIGDIAFIKGGKRVPKGKKLTDVKTEYPYIRVTDFSDDGTIDTTKIQYITEDIYNEIKNYTITCKDLYISIAGTIGKTGIIPKELDGANLTENAVKLVYKIQEIDNKFVYLFTLSNFFKEQAGLATKVVAMPKLAISRLSEIKIPLPPLEEQGRIVGVLDGLFGKIDTSIALLDESIASASSLLPSALNEVFEELGEKWEKKFLNQVTINHDGKRIPIKEDKRIKNINGYPYYGASGIVDYVDDYIFDGEYLLISEDGANLVIRKTPIAFIASGKFWVNNHAHIVQAIQEITSNKYLEYFFAHVDISLYITGAAQPKLSQKKLFEIPIIIPPLDIQTQTVAYLDALHVKADALKKAQEKKKEALLALKASLLESAFKGEL